MDSKQSVGHKKNSEAFILTPHPNFEMEMMNDEDQSLIPHQLICTQMYILLLPHFR